MEQIVYKAGPDSYSGKINNLNKMVGTWQITGLSKAGLKTHDSDRLMAFYYYAYQASMLGYDYVIMSGKRTNSGRNEAVKTTAVNIKAGERLYKSGYCPAFRKPYDHPAKICKDDMSVPCEGSPKNYCNIPEFVKESESNNQLSDVHEDELMALIDCLTGEGDRAKAFRAMARYLVKEAIQIENEVKKEVL